MNTKSQVEYGDEYHGSICDLRRIMINHLVNKARYILEQNIAIN